MRVAIGEERPTVGGEGGDRRREVEGEGRAEGAQHEDFQEVTHPSTTLAQARLTSEF